MTSNSKLVKERLEELLDATKRGSVDWAIQQDEDTLVGVTWEAKGDGWTASLLGEYVLVTLKIETARGVVLVDSNGHPAIRSLYYLLLERDAEELAGMQLDALEKVLDGLPE